MSSSSTDNENLLDYKNASGLICGQDNNTCIIKVYYEKFIGLELTYIYIDKSNNTVAGSVNNMLSGKNLVTLLSKMVSQNQ